jgi:hypothetical protein
MTSYLDVLVAVVTGLMALCAFTLLAVCSTRAGNWVTPPRHIRYGIFVTGMLMMIKSVNLFSLADGPSGARGHVNYESAVLACAMLYTAVTLTAWIIGLKAPIRVWDRMAYAFGRAARHDEVPVMMPMAEVVDIHHALGTPTVAPAEPTFAVVREARRHRA